MSVFFHRIPHGHYLRYGVNWTGDAHGQHNYIRWRLTLLLPLGVYKRKRVYDIANDFFRRGWFTLVCGLTLERLNQNNIALRFSYGWVPRPSAEEVVA